MKNTDLLYCRYAELDDESKQQVFKNLWVRAVIMQQFGSTKEQTFSKVFFEEVTDILNELKAKMTT